MQITTLALDLSDFAQLKCHFFKRVAQFKKYPLLCTPFLRTYNPIYNVTSLRNHGKKGDEREYRLAFESQDQAQILSQFANEEVLHSRRRPLGDAESFDRSDPYHQQKGNFGLPERSTGKGFHRLSRINVFLGRCHFTVGGVFF